MFEPFFGRADFSVGSVYAVEYYKVEIAMRDSVQNEENYKKVQKQQARYEYQKQAAIDSVAHDSEIQLKILNLSLNASVFMNSRMSELLHYRNVVNSCWNDSTGHKYSIGRYMHTHVTITFL